MPARNENSRHREPFLLGQPVWYLEADHLKVRWSLGIDENDPTTENEQSDRPRRGVELDDPELMSKGESPGKWVRIDRQQMLKHAISFDEDWRRVALVCGAGLGKTTNLKWLEAKINRLSGGRAPHLAVFQELRELDGDPDRITELIANQWLKDRHATGSVEQRKFAVERMLAQGRVTFLLDSLDQANPDPNGAAVRALGRLVTNWKKCRVWVSGRPYAFRTASKEMQDMAGNTPWQFLRIGPLDEPECRQLLEITRRPYDY